MGTFFVAAILAIIIFLIIKSIYKQKKKGKCLGCCSVSDSTCNGCSRSSVVIVAVDTSVDITPNRIQNYD
ncbi:MAG: FeoB-associated Cys-rich membrane protein [Oscillospiraceae bacterium]|jgi:hypothetical protein|nr:FeoB-associated Cys-rich membrane protein [Oscillospiraceae bacterium]